MVNENNFNKILLLVVMGALNINNMVAADKATGAPKTLAGTMPPPSSYVQPGTTSSPTSVSGDNSALSSSHGDASGIGSSSSGPFSTVSQVVKEISVNHAHSKPGYSENIKNYWKHLSSDNPKAYLSVQNKNNKVYVKGEEQHIVDLENYIESLDKPITQVRIDAIILFASRDYNFDIGIDWSGIYNRSQSIINSNTSFGLAGLGGALTDIPKPTSPVGTQFGDTTTGSTTSNLFVNPANYALNLFNKVLSPTTSAAAGDSFVKIPLVFGGPDLSLSRLNLVLNAAENERKVKVVSRPSVLTGSGQQAVVKIGTQLPMQQSQINTSTNNLYKGNSIVYKSVGITLTVTPTIGADNKSISLDIDLMNIQLTKGTTVSNDVGIMTNPPQLSDLSVTNKVVLKNGQTTVIGGLAKRRNENTKNRVPFIHKIPLLGNLFKASLTEDSEEEQFIFITPTIIETSV
jgi:type IV pilus assembly protein PilQ